LLDGAKAMRARLTAGNPESPLLIYVGRLGTEKRLRDLKAVLDRLPEARLAIVGKGPDMEPLQAHFAGTSTVFTGLLSGVELSQAFAAADVFVMPSDSETLGFVVLESMASGVPVVGCNAGGIPSIIDQDETGFLFEAGNTEQLASYVERLITDRPLAATMAAAARTEAERLGWEECTTKLREETYLQAVRNHRERQADVRTLRQKLKRYKEALAKGSRADVFAFFGDRKAEREAEKLEIEEWQLVEDIETLEKKPTTRQLLGWLSPRFDMPVRLGALLLFPWRFFTTQLRKFRGMLLSLLGGRGADPDPPLALETSS
jgi:sulfoquinovosyltransferase